MIGTFIGSFIKYTFLMVLKDIYINPSTPSPDATRNLAAPCFKGKLEEQISDGWLLTSYVRC